MDELMPILNEIKDTMLSVVNMQTITLIIINILSTCLALYIGWFAIRSIVNSLKSALNGKLSIGGSSRREFDNDWELYGNEWFSNKREFKKFYKSGKSLDEYFE